MNAFDILHLMRKHHITINDILKANLDMTRRLSVKHFYENVPGLGNVAISRHAQVKILELGLSDFFVEKLLRDGSHWDSIKEGEDIIWKERMGIRAVILTKPVPDRGAKLVKTIFKIEPQKDAKKK